MTIPPTVCGTTANFPGIPARTAIQRLLDGVYEPVYGRLSTEHVQICPQNRGHINEAFCEELLRIAPGTQFRLHANAKVMPKHHFLDASTLDDSTLPYYRELADRSKRLGARVYTLHAGNQRNATREQMRDAVLRLGDIFGECRVGVEGLYPRTREPQLIDSWPAYEWLMDQGIAYAIDLSHLKIVARADGGWQDDLVKALLINPDCVEVHVSDNDGLQDKHLVQQEPMPWHGLLDFVQPNATIFSEGDHARGERRS